MIKQQQDIRFQNIPAPDALIGIYASYFVGAHQQETDGKPSIKINFGMRSKNVYDMDDAMKEGFDTKNGPWIMLDSLSDGRNGSKAGIDMGGGHFLTIYHKETKQIMIATPGMEYDYSLKDTVEDAIELFTGNQKQTKALYNYVRETEDKISKGLFQDHEGDSLEISNPKPVIAAHSMSCKPAHTMAALGYPVIAVESRPLTNGYLKSIADMCKNLSGEKIEVSKAFRNITKNCTSVNAQHCNVWNSVVLPWVKQRTTGERFEYGTNKKATLADRHVAGHHAAEVLTPSLLTAFNTNSAAMKAPKRQDGMILQSVKSRPKTFWQDVFKR